MASDALSLDARLIVALFDRGDLQKQYSLEIHNDRISVI
jgi:hypothetical protein